MIQFLDLKKINEPYETAFQEKLKSVLETDNVMIVVEATHLCVSSRGIKDESSYTSTLQYGGVFNQKEFRDDFYKMIHKDQ